MRDFFLLRYIEQHVDVALRGAVTSKVNEMFPEIKLIPAPTSAPAAAAAPAPAKKDTKKAAAGKK